MSVPQVFTSFTKPIQFLCQCKGFPIIIYLDDILVLVHSKCTGRMAYSFLCSLFVMNHVLTLSKSDIFLTQDFLFLGLCWDTLGMCVSLSGNLNKIQ